jgi:cell division protein FtsW
MVIVAFSFVFVYACFSASSNLAYLGHGTGNTLGYLVKHFIHICVVLPLSFST